MLRACRATSSHGSRPMAQRREGIAHPQVGGRKELPHFGDLANISMPAEGESICSLSRDRLDPP